MTRLRLLRNLAFVLLVAATAFAGRVTVKADPYAYCASITPEAGCTIWLDGCSPDLNNDGDVCGYLCNQIYGGTGGGGWYDSDSYSCHCSGGSCGG
jgi:hypothetical protein